MDLKVPPASFGKPLTWYHWWFWRVVRCVAWLLGMRRDASLAMIPQEGPIVVVAPHLSFFDPLFLAAALPRPSRFIAAAFFVMKNGLFSWLCFLAGAIPVQRNRKDPSAIRKALRLLARGELVAFFPEGGRTWTGVPNLPMTPAAKLLLGLKVPIYVAAFEGAYDSWPRFSWRPRARRVPVRIVGPLSISRNGYTAPPRVDGMIRPWWSTMYARTRKADVGRVAQEIRSQLTQAAAGEAGLLRLEIPERLPALTRVLCYCPECACVPLASAGYSLHCPACGASFRAAGGGRLCRVPPGGGVETDLSLHELFSRMVSRIEARTRSGLPLEVAVEAAEVGADSPPAHAIPFGPASARLDRSGIRIRTASRVLRLPLETVAGSAMMGSEMLEIPNGRPGSVVYVRAPGGAMRILLTARAYLGLPFDSMNL